MDSIFIKNYGQDLQDCKEKFELSTFQKKVHKFDRLRRNK